MIACPFIAQTAVNQLEIGRRFMRDKLTGRCNTHQKFTARNKKLLCNQYRKRRSDRTTYNAGKIVADP